jgi:hypothetical protein
VLEQLLLGQQLAEAALRQRPEAPARHGASSSSIAFAASQSTSSEKCVRAASRVLRPRRSENCPPSSIGGCSDKRRLGGLHVRAAVRGEVLLALLDAPQRVQRRVRDGATAVGMITREASPMI